MLIGSGAGFVKPAGQDIPHLQNLIHPLSGVSYRNRQQEQDLLLHQLVIYILAP
jgi:hypothetical protein